MTSLLMSILRWQGVACRLAVSQCAAVPPSPPLSSQTSKACLSQSSPLGWLARYHTNLPGPRYLVLVQSDQIRWCQTEGCPAVSSLLSPIPGLPGEFLFSNYAVVFCPCPSQEPGATAQLGPRVMFWIQTTFSVIYCPSALVTSDSCSRIVGNSCVETELKHAEFVSVSQD